MLRMADWNRCCSAHHLLASSKFHLKNFNHLCLARDVDFPYTLSSHNVSYATIMRNRIFTSLPHIRKMGRSGLFLNLKRIPRREISIYLLKPPHLRRIFTQICEREGSLENPPPSAAPEGHVEGRRILFEVQNIWPHSGRSRNQDGQRPHATGRFLLTTRLYGQDLKNHRIGAPTHTELI